MRTQFRAAAAILFVAGLAAPAAAQLELRGVAAPMEGVVEGVLLEGVIVAPGQGAAQTGQRRMVGWDLVRRVGGNLSGAAAQFAPVTDAAWRARARLERGDWTAAEPLFEELSLTYRGLAGPTAAVAHEGLLRCRLRRGAQGAAVWAWLDWIGALRRAGPAGREAWVGGRIDLPPIRDASTDLVPGLPPIWVGGSAMGIVARSDEWTRFNSADGAVGELAALYRYAAAAESGGEAQPLPKVSTDHPGVRLAWEIVASRAGSAEERAAARTALERRVTRGGGANAVAPEPWVEAWARAALGRSLVLEQAVADRRRGVMQLLHVPARFTEEHPYLAGVCLAEAAVAMKDLGDAGAASALLAELRIQFPHHPALGWERLREIAAAPTTGPGQVRTVAARGRGRGGERGSPPSPATTGDTDRSSGGAKNTLTGDWN